MDNIKIFNDEIFKPDFRLDGDHLVAASAGTGKTYNIQNIYARLIMEKSLRVSQIQVMTFTEAATKELKDRLRTVLKDVHARLNNLDCDGKDERDIKDKNNRADKLIAACQGDPAAKQNAIELALLEFDGAAISTIHGFCSRALSRYAFETHTAFSTEIEDNKIAELTSRTRDWWRRRVELAPAEILPELDYNILLDDVKALSGKTDWRLDVKEKNTPSGFMLEQAAKIVDDYEKDRINRKTQTYDDLLRAMRDALHGAFGEEFAAKLRGEFKAALIDEFQDTDPVQYEIFRKVFMADSTVPVFFVGDPKQAIYAFRGGDIFTYRKAAKSIDNGSKFLLDTNYRSTQRLMDAVNAIFKDNPESEYGSYTFGDSEIPYQQDIKADKKSALQVDGGDDPQPFRIIHVNDSKDALYLTLAQEVAKTLNDYAGILSPKDVAILVKAKDNAKDIMQKLRDCNVPCTIQNPGNVFTVESGSYGNKTYKPSRMLRDFYNVLLACAKTGGKKQVCTALSTLFFGLSSSELLSIDENTLADWIGKFNDINRIWLKRGFGAAMSKIQEYGFRNGVGYRERFASLPDGERLLADCGQIIELTVAATREVGPSPLKLIEWLEKRITNAADENDSDAYARELESENDAVRIMTMHVSKGLQFPVVFLPDCNVKSHGSGSQKAFCYHDKNNDNALTFTVSGGEESDSEQFNTEEEQELLRLLYVAMTRAEQRTVALYNNAPNGPLARLLANAQLNGAGKDAPESPIKWIDDYVLQDPPPQYNPAVNDSTLIPAEKPKKFDNRPKKGSYSAISPSISDDNISDDGKDNDAQDNSSNSANSNDKQKLPVFQIHGGALIGSCWHEILERLPFDSGEEAVRTLSHDVLASYGFDPQAQVGSSNFLDITSEMIIKTLNRKIISPDGKPFTLRDIPMNERLSELEFNFSSANAYDNTVKIAEAMKRHWQGDPSMTDFLLAVEDWKRAIPNGFINGFIDLVFMHDGFYYIVDWKSNIIGGNEKSFTEEGVRREMATHGYFFQYLLYSAVLQRYLKDLPGGGYSWDRNFGGIRYYFLRGIDAGMDAAVFKDRPSELMLDEIGEILGMEVKK